MFSGYQDSSDAFIRLEARWAKSLTCTLKSAALRVIDNIQNIIMGDIHSLHVNLCCIFRFQ